MPKKGKPIIKFDCISKRYNRCGVVVIALADFSLKIHPGEFLSIITLLDVEDLRFYIVWGLLDRPSSGKAYISGKDTSMISGKEVAIARALINNPVLVLADEPTSALDSESSEEIMEQVS